MINVALDFLSDKGPLIILPLFMVIFLAFGFWAYRPRNKDRMSDYAEIPFKESHDGD